jgi:predicted nucleic acid-binding protein
MRFVDTNVLLYAISEDRSETAKRDTALAILQANDLVLSVQVLQEFYTQATRAMRSGRLMHAEATALITAWQRFRVQELNVTLVERAMATSQRFQISYWDSAIIEAARAAGCETVLSEDLQHGQNFDGVRVIDPFRAA